MVLMLLALPMLRGVDGTISSAADRSI